MNRSTLGVLVLLLFLVGCIVASNSGYNQGFYDGLRELCPFGDLNVYPEGDIRCELPVDESEEVVFYGFEV